MFTQEYEFITDKTPSEIVEFLDYRKGGKSLTGEVRIDSEFIGKYDENGFELRRISFMGSTFTKITAKFTNQTFNTKVKIIFSISKIIFANEILALIFVLYGFNLFSIEKILTAKFIIITLSTLIIINSIFYYGYKTDTNVAKVFLQKLFDNINFTSH